MNKKFTRIGIPRGMYFYKYYPAAEAFLTELGAEVVPSPETTKEILDNGIRQSIDDACIPVKTFHGHVHYLKDKVDCMLIPRLTSVVRNEYICPTVGGLPEMVKYSMEGLPPMVLLEVDLYKNNKPLKSALYKLAHDIGPYPASDVRKAMAKAKQAYEDHLKKLRSGELPDRVIDRIPANTRKVCRRIGIIGHPYLLYDGFVNLNLFKKLDSRGIGYMTPDMMDPVIIEAQCCELPKRMFWTSGKTMIGSALYMMDSNKLDGIIYITSFGCGVDSIVGDYITRRLRQSCKKPHMVLNIDEHTGAACFDTRLEAYLDMLE